MPRSASARAITSWRSAAKRKCVSRSAVFGPIPGSLPSSCVKRAMAPSGSVSTEQLLELVTWCWPRHLCSLRPKWASGHAGQIHGAGDSEAGGHFAGLLGHLGTGALQGLVHCRPDQILKQLLVIGLHGLIADETGG